MKFFFKLIGLSILFSWGVCVSAKDGYQFVDAKANALGGCSAVLPGFLNPSLYVFFPSEGRIASLQYRNKYAMKEFSTYAGMFNFPNRYLNAGLYISRYGFKAYHETMVSLHAYRQLSKHLSLGVRVDYLNLHYSPSESNKSAVTADLFLSAQPVDNLFLSLVAMNPIAVDVKVGEDKLEIPIILALGARYMFQQKFGVQVELEKDFSHPLVGKLGLEYIPIRQLSIRAGIYGKPFTPSFGIGLQLSPFLLDVSFSRHPVLGFCSSCGLSFRY